MADIAIRLMGGGRVPEQKKDTGDGQALQIKPSNVSDKEWQEHLEIMKEIADYNATHPEDEPFRLPATTKDAIVAGNILRNHPCIFELIKKLHLQFV